MKIKTNVFAVYSAKNRKQNTSRLTYEEVLKVLLQQTYALRNPRYLSEMRSIEFYLGFLALSIDLLKY